MMNKRTEIQRRWDLKHPGYHQQWRAKNKDRVNASHKKWRLRIRREALEYYSGGQPCCACCGESHIEFLCIDHIDGGGNKHRKSLGSSGGFIYEWLKANGYPKGFRVLCANCNMALAHYGCCPHQKEAKE